MTITEATQLSRRPIDGRLWDSTQVQIHANGGLLKAYQWHTVILAGGVALCLIQTLNHLHDLNIFNRQIEDGGGGGGTFPYRFRKELIHSNLLMMIPSSIITTTVSTSDHHGRRRICLSYNRCI